MSIFISLLQVDKELLQMIGSALLCTGKNRKSQIIITYWILLTTCMIFVLSILYICICICIVLQIILTSAEVKWNLHNFAGCVYNAFSVHSQVLPIQRNKILPKRANKEFRAGYVPFLQPSLKTRSHGLVGPVAISKPAQPVECICTTLVPWNQCWSGGQILFECI